MSSLGKFSEQKIKQESKLNVQNSYLEIPQIPTNFHFYNGDEYAGESMIYKEKQKMVMQGKGIYNTYDGQTYEGIWEDDYLNDECKITFPDKTVFTGNLNEMLITGKGKYYFKEKVQLEGEFINNELIGDVYIKDPNQNYWKGNIDDDGQIINFYPLHPFWQSVLNLPSKIYPLFYGEHDEECENITENN